MSTLLPCQRLKTNFAAACRSTRTDSVIKQLQQDGTYKIAHKSNADAVLKAEITEINRTPARSVRGKRPCHDRV